MLILLSLCRPIEVEFDDLNLKSREAEKEVNMLQMKLQEANHNLSKLHKDRDCKPHSIIDI